MKSPLASCILTCTHVQPFLYPSLLPLLCLSLSLNKYLKGKIYLHITSNSIRLSVMVWYFVLFNGNSVGVGERVPPALLKNLGFIPSTKHLNVAYCPPCLDPVPPSDF